MYASRPLSAGTVVEISPVLLFSRDEWDAHGCKTILDCYTFKWGRMGEMALALGLGSMFNHSPRPSVAFYIDKPTHSIRYTLVRDVDAGEELCISYGPWGRQYEERGDDYENGVVSDTDEEEDLANFLRIGQERSDSEDDGRARHGQHHTPRARTRTRHAGGAAASGSSSASSSSASSSGSASPSPSAVAGSRPLVNGRREAVVDTAAAAAADTAATVTATTSPASTLASTSTRELTSSRSTRAPTRRSTSNSPAAISSSRQPIWRLTSLPDPTTTPLRLIDCYALVLPARASSQVLSFLKRHCSALGRGKSLGCEDDAIRHAKTLAAGGEADGGGGGVDAVVGNGQKVKMLNGDAVAGNGQNVKMLNAVGGSAVATNGPKVKMLKALLCPVDNIDEDALRGLLEKDGLSTMATSMSTPPTQLVRAQVADSPAPIKARLAEWCAAWPVALRSTTTGGGSGGGVATSASASASGSGNSSPVPSLATTAPTPLSAALALASAPPKPSLFIDRQGDGQFWTPPRTQWVVSKLARCVLLAHEARRNGQVPVGVHVCPSILPVDVGAGVPASTSASPGHTALCWDANGIPHPGGEAIEADAYDTRVALKNPIKHAVGNAIQKVAELRAARRGGGGGCGSGAGGAGGTATTAAAATTTSMTATPLPSSPPTNPLSFSRRRSSAGSASPRPVPVGAAAAATSPSPSSSALLNGQDYLLTSLTLFATHEPCVYCCMSLVHSRVRTLIFLQPSRGSGGCCGSELPRAARCDGGLDNAEGDDVVGGPYALQEQKGLNHRFEVWKWRGGLEAVQREVDEQRGRRRRGGGDGEVVDAGVDVDVDVDVEALLDLKAVGVVDP